MHISKSRFSTQFAQNPVEKLEIILIFAARTVVVWRVAMSGLSLLFLHLLKRKVMCMGTVIKETRA